MSRINIGIDAMGGDKAPEQIVLGTINAANAKQDVNFTLIGKEEEILRWELPKNVRIVNARDAIEDDEPPVQALRTKRDSSIMRGIKLVLEKNLSAFVSAGSTGAVVAASIFKLGYLEGVKKCGILVTLPTKNGMAALVDAGANLNPKPIHYLQYAIMGSCYINILHPGKEINIGLLNVGEETTKGTEPIKQAHKLLKSCLTNFKGNVEGHEILSGNFQLILCDGFVGNIVLKLGESMASFLMNGLKSMIESSIELKDKFREFNKPFDFSEYGGAPILGINGTVLIAHGRSDNRAITNALFNAINMVQNDINGKISEEIKQHSLWKRIQKMLNIVDES
ncbi:MAG: phosphate acyltransferase PlsX [Planctomycetes bacterium]|nr:phosphate acyltransferase PlsX [Planctomycetota bacterium]